MDPVPIVVDRELLQLSLKVLRIPKQHVIQILAPNCSDQPFDKRVRDRQIRNGLNLLDTEDTKIGLSALEREQWIVVRAQPPRDTLPDNRAIEYPAQRNPIDRAGLNPKPDDAPGELVHYHKDPMGLEPDRFATKQIDTPQAVACVTDQGQPGRPTVAGIGPKVLGEHAAHDILIDLDAEHPRNQERDAGTAILGIPALGLDNGPD